MGIPNQYNSQPVLEGFSIPEHDYIKLTYYSGTNLVATATYKYGGSSGTTVGTLIFTYDGNDYVDTITRT